MANSSPIVSNVPRKRAGKALWIVGAVVLAVLAGVARYRAVRNAHKPKFDTVTVDRGHIFAKVTASGTVSALVTVQVGSQVSGRVQKIFADYNTAVKAGQVVAKIDPQFYEAAREQAHANDIAAAAALKKAQVQAADAMRQLNRTRALAGEHLVAQADLDTAQANAEAAEASVDAAAAALEQAKATLHQAEVNLDYTTIRSPIDGVVISRSVDVGQTVAAQFQAPVLFTIAEDLSKMQVDTNVSEADIGKLHPGMTAYFTVDAYPGEKFKGIVRQIRHAAQTVQNVVTYDAVIDVDNSGLKLEPSMTANVLFIYSEKDNVLRIPSAALRFKPPNDVLASLHDGQPETPKAHPNHLEAPNHRSVWRLAGSEPQEVSVVTGVSDGFLTEVEAGELHENDTLIVDITSDASKH